MSIPTSIKDFLQITCKGEDVFVIIHKPSTQPDSIQYGSVTEYIRSLNLNNVDYNALKTAYKQAQGYPVLIAKRPVGFGTASRFRIEISNDRMFCYLILLPPRENEKKSETSLILSELKKKGVVYGIQMENIEKSVNNNIFKKRITAAAGLPPVSGRDLKLKPLIAGDKNLINLVTRFSTKDSYDKFEFFSPVSAGDIITGIEQATPGTPGLTIFNEKVPTITGESKEITGSNIEIRRNNVTAKINGRVLLNQIGVEVEPVLVVNAIINKEIRYDGSIKILGDVDSCPIIEASGDIEVHGVVSDTPLNAGRNIIIHNNLITSLNKPITAGRDFAGRNIFNADITAENIIALSTIFKSKLSAYISIRTLAEDGCIVGGYAQAGLSVRARALGSEKCIATQINVGTPQIISRFRKYMVAYYSRMIDDIAKIKNEIIKKIQKLDMMKNQPGERNPGVYMILTNQFKADLDRHEHEISSLYTEIVKIKDPRFSLITGDITSDFFCPNTILAMGRGQRKINELRKKLRFTLREGNIFTEDMRKDSES